MSKKKRKPNLDKISIRSPSTHLSRGKGKKKASAKKKSKRRKKRGKKKKSVEAKTQGRLTPARLSEIYSGGRGKPVASAVENREISFSSATFQPNPTFERDNNEIAHYELYHQSVEIQEQDGDEIHLSIGMDVGTSCTKVVIGDIDSDRFYAVPFTSGAENNYLLPTEVKQAKGVVYPISCVKEAKIHKNLKLDLIDSPRSGKYRLRLVAYIAYVIRHSVNWFLQNYWDYVAEREVIWTLNIGVPAGKGDQSSLSKLFLTLSTAAGQAAISSGEYFNEQDLKNWLEEATRDSRRVAGGGKSEFSFLETDRTVVAAIPEVAAQMYGLKKSNKWSDSRPITFLIDVGAGTVDAGVFSIMPSTDRADHDLAFNLFSANVSPTGVKRLHISRVRWLQEKLPKEMPLRKRILSHLKAIESISIAGIRLPSSVRKYVNTLIIPAKSESPDKIFHEKIINDIHRIVLRRAQSDNPNDSTWLKLRTIISGGGSESEYYKKIVNSMSSMTLKLSVVKMEIPKNLNAPGTTSKDYHRLSVAYGLAHYDKWKFRWPRNFKPIPRQPKVVSTRYVSKDDV